MIQIIEWHRPVALELALRALRESLTERRCAPGHFLVLTHGANFFERFFPPHRIVETPHLYRARRFTALPLAVDFGRFYHRTLGANSTGVHLRRMIDEPR